MGGVSQEELASAELRGLCPSFWDDFRKCNGVQTDPTRRARVGKGMEFGFPVCSFSSACLSLFRSSQLLSGGSPCTCPLFWGLWSHVREGSHAVFWGSQAARVGVWRGPLVADEVRPTPGTHGGFRGVSGLRTEENEGSCRRELVLAGSALTCPLGSAKHLSPSSLPDLLTTLAPRGNATSRGQLGVPSELSLHLQPSRLLLPLRPCSPRGDQTPLTPEPQRGILLPQGPRGLNLQNPLRENESLFSILNITE